MTIPRDPPDFLADEPATDRARPAHEESVPLPMEPDASAISRWTELATSVIGMCAGR
jgi:hypothetical protein